MFLKKPINVYVITKLLFFNGNLIQLEFSQKFVFGLELRS
uniref:Uncharacterized protein n=1 Tax=Anguilla anguilla TaxID=7936 RepID=A0A0E9VTW9_ANGAN